MLKGSISGIAASDSWFYGNIYGVQSFLLDDDLCYCHTLIEAGGKYCGSPQRGSPGVDAIAPANKCSSINPKGVLSMYFRAAPPPPLKASTCAEAGSALKKSGLYTLKSGSSTFVAHCLLAKDAGTSGAAFTRFWHYDGRSSGWPSGTRDVLAQAYGTCQGDKYCFGRLPKNLPEDGSELLVSDGKEMIKWTFKSGCNTAHAVFQSLRDRKMTKSSNGCHWKPSVLKGSIRHVAASDSWFYGNTFGVTSFLLDDDHCYCHSLIEAGEIYCNGGRWGQAAMHALLGRVAARRELTIHG